MIAENRDTGRVVFDSSLLFLSAQRLALSRAPGDRIAPDGRARRLQRVLDGPSKEPARLRSARESHDARMTHRAARGDANGGKTRAVKTETRRPFTAPTERPERSTESGPTRMGERGHGDSNDPSSGAMATPPTAATHADGVNPPFETSRTTRGTDTPERVMAQVLNDPCRRLSPTVADCRPQPRRRAREPPRAIANTAAIGKPTHPIRTC